MCQAGAQVDEKDGLYLKLPESRKDAQPLPQGQVCAAREAGTWGRGVRSLGGVRDHLGREAYEEVRHTRFCKMSGN